jgi:hypothetical protein
MNPAETYIDQLPEPFRQIALELQVLIEAQFPNIQLKYKWRLPFYYLDDKTMFCFLNYRKKYLDLGLPYAASLEEKYPLLINDENRKMLRSLRFYEPEDIDARLLSKLLSDLQKIRT